MLANSESQKSYVLPHMQIISRENATMLLDLGHMTGENIYGRYGVRQKTQNMKAFDVPTPEELIQKP
jgi:hypothetical protein